MKSNIKDLRLGVVTILFLLSLFCSERASRDLKLSLLTLARLSFDLFVGKEQFKGARDWALNNLDCIMDKHSLYLHPFFWKMEKTSYFRASCYTEHRAGRYFIVCDPQEFLWNKPTWTHPFSDVHLIQIGTLL